MNCLRASFFLKGDMFLVIIYRDLASYCKRNFLLHSGLNCQGLYWYLTVLSRRLTLLHGMLHLSVYPNSSLCKSNLSWAITFFSQYPERPKNPDRSSPWREDAGYLITKTWFNFCISVRKLKFSLISLSKREFSSYFYFMAWQNSNQVRSMKVRYFANDVIKPKGGNKNTSFPSSKK